MKSSFELDQTAPLFSPFLWLRQAPRSLPLMADWPGHLPRHFKRPHSRTAWSRNPLSFACRAVTRLHCRRGLLFSLFRTEPTSTSVVRSSTLSARSACFDAAYRSPTWESGRDGDCNRSSHHLSWAPMAPKAIFRWTRGLPLPPCRRHMSEPQRYGSKTAPASSIAPFLWNGVIMKGTTATSR